MTTFEEALRNNLKGPSEVFRQADFDLHQEVLAASQATERVTDDAYRLVLEPVTQNASGVTYGLLLEERQRGKTGFVDTFLVPFRGYPIRAANATLAQAGNLSEWLPLQDRSAIQRYLTEQAANPDSELVTRIALLLPQPIS